MKAPSAADAAAKQILKRDIQATCMKESNQQPEKGTTKRRTLRNGDSISSLNLGC